MFSHAQHTRTALLRALVAGGLLLAAGGAQAAVFDLQTGTTSLTLPDGTVVPMWGFGLQGAADVSVPGPELVVPPGDTTLTINLVNNLPVAVSIVIPALPAALAPRWNDGTSGPRANLQQRVLSFAAVAAPNGGTASYTWNNLRPGTYLYHSGARPAAQVQMGLYGVAKHDEAAGSAYPGVAYDKDVVLLYSEIDPVAHEAIVAGSYQSPVDYRPRYFLVNGAPSAVPPPIPAGNVNERILVRLLNAGLRSVIPAIDGGAYLSLLAEDGHAYPYARSRYSALLAAGKTLDALFVPTAAGSFAIADRALHAAAGPSGGQIVVKLDIGSVAGAPVAVADSYTLAEDGSLDTLAAGVDGVLLNDSGAATAVLASDVQAGTLVLNADGSFVYQPKANFAGTDFFTYRAESGGVLSNVVTVELDVSGVPDPPMAMDDSYQTAPGVALKLMAPGVLANDTDPDGDMLMADLVSGPSGGTLTLLPTGELTYTPNAGTTADSFSYRAFDGTAYSEPATVSIAIVATSVPPVAVNDFATASPNTSIAVNLVVNDYDPDGAVDPATLALAAPPSMGGAVVLHADGTVTYTPKAAFLGTEVFSYTVRDNQGLVSAPAEVQINVVSP